MKTNMIVNVTNNDKTPPETLVVEVSYQNIDGYHVFTSDSVAGLLIASKDAGKALNQLCPTIQYLVEKNAGFPCTAEIANPLRILPGGKKETPQEGLMENKIIILRAA